MRRGTVEAGCRGNTARLLCRTKRHALLPHNGCMARVFAPGWKLSPVTPPTCHQCSIEKLLPAAMCTRIKPALLIAAADRAAWPGSG